MAHAGLPLGGAFQLRVSSPVNCSLPLPLRFGGRTQCAAEVFSGMMNSGNGCLVRPLDEGLAVFWLLIGLSPCTGRTFFYIPSIIFSDIPKTLLAGEKSVTH